MFFDIMFFDSLAYILLFLHRTEKYLLHFIFYERPLAFGRDYPAMPISRLGRREFQEVSRGSTQSISWQLLPLP